MQIIYEPEVLNGEQRQGDTINKYSYYFEKGKAREVNDADALKFLLSPLFREDKPTISADITPKPKKVKPKITKLKI